MLAPRLDLHAASRLKSALIKKNSENIILDFSEVKFIGALCLQVLIAASRCSMSHGRGFSLINISDRVKEQLRLVGISPSDLSEGKV